MESHLRPKIALLLGLNPTRVLFVHKPSLPRYGFAVCAMRTHERILTASLVRRLLLRVRNFHHIVRVVFIVTQFPNTPPVIFYSYP